MILVTGGTGLIGSHLLYELMKTEQSVRAIYRDSKRISRVKMLFDYYSSSTSHSFDNIEWVEADVLDIVSLEDALEGITQVYHCAALVSFAKKDFSRLIKINREGTFNLVNLCIEKGVQKFGHISSTAAIGGQQNQLTTEATKWKQSPRTSGYAISKYSSEKEVWRAVEEGMDVVILNPSVIIGAGDWNESSMTIFRTVQNGLKFYTPGQNALVDARDVATVFVKLMKSDVKNERFLCISENVPFKSYLQQIAERLSVKAPSINTPKWLIGVVWRIVGVVAWLRGKHPTITKETAHSAFSTMEYSNEKVSKLLDYKFIPVKDAIDNAVKAEEYFKKLKRD